MRQFIGRTSMTVQHLARRFLFLKPLLNIIVVIALATVAFLFLFSTIAMQNQYALPSLILAVWCLLFSALLGLFASTPKPQITSQSWFSRFRYKLLKGLFSLSLVLFLFMTLALLYATVKLLRVWL